MEVHEQMRAEWNERAQEDAHYFVAFGRRDQDDEEFFSTASDVVRELEEQLTRLPAARRHRALEIGCGPGRLLRPMSSHFDEVHGVDVSDAMVERAEEKLRGIPNAFAHHASGSDLALFPDEHFDFVYSYAVFQHIPSRDVVFSYMRETARVLAPGGIAHLQFNGLPGDAKVYTTWEGIRVSAADIHALTAEQGIRLVSLNGIDTQYMWTTWQKPSACRIRSVSNALTSEQPVPRSGRMACAALSFEKLPEGCDLNTLRVAFDGIEGRVCYVRPQRNNGMTQVNVFLPPNPRTGLLPVSVQWNGQRLCPDAYVRVIVPGPAVPELTALSDGVDLLSPQRITSGAMKATIEEVDEIGGFAATVDGIPVTGIETFRADPLVERWEVNFLIPVEIGSGGHVLEVRLGRRLLARTGIEVVR